VTGRAGPLEATTGTRSRPLGGFSGWPQRWHPL